jgi:hypothetical protein
MNEDLIFCIMNRLQIDGGANYEGKQFPSLIIYQVEEIIKKYSIEDKNSVISIAKAILFLNDVFGLTWSYPDVLVRNAIKFDCMDIEKNKIYNRHKISVENLFKLMFIPFYKIMSKGRIMRKKDNNNETSSK